MLDSGAAVGESALAIVCLKAFGDFVIARTSVERVAPDGGRNALIIAGGHLRELDTALGGAGYVRFIEHGEPGVPAVFDIRLRGWRRAAASAWRVRRQMQALSIDQAATVVFDRLHARERFLAGARSAGALPIAPNIYLSYKALLAGGASAAVELPLPVAATGRAGSARHIGIFPGSRLAAKVLPADVIEYVVKRCVAAGCRPTVYVLDGEAVDLPGSVPAVRLPRRFEATVAAVRGLDAVMSADSMPAHLAEFMKRPVFVLNRVGNPYWLPLSAFRRDRWCTFAQVSSSPALAEFLA